MIKKLIKETLYRYINEMPQITRQGSKVMADGKLLKALATSEVHENIVVFRQPDSNGIFDEGKTWGYFLDSPQAAAQLKKGEIDMLMFPFRGRYSFGSAPISDVWKKNKRLKGTEHILAIWDGFTDENEIYVDKVSVRPGYKKASIASKMMDIFRENYPNAKITVTGVTDEGKKFFSKYTKTPPEEFYNDGELYKKDDGKEYHRMNKFDPSLKMVNPKGKPITNA